VLAGGAVAGWLGELHPAVAAAWELPGGAAFEVDHDVLFAAAPAELAYEDVTSFPAVRRDLAVVTQHPSALIVDAIRGQAPLLETVKIFDVYTLTDEEVDKQVDAITQALAKLGAELRA
jgi:phenylalanyl-tRNA synthetase beta chain